MILNIIFRYKRNKVMAFLKTKFNFNLCNYIVIHTYLSVGWRNTPHGSIVILRHVMLVSLNTLACDNQVLHQDSVATVLRLYL